MAKKKKYIVYSTNPDFNYDNDEEENEETLDAKDQKPIRINRSKATRRKRSDFGRRIHR